MRTTLTGGSRLSVVEGRERRKLGHVKETSRVRKWAGDLLLPVVVENKADYLICVAGRKEKK